MPRGDGTGPMGMGPMTGRGAGFCASFAAPGFANGGIGYGRNFGRGRGLRRMYYATGMPGWANSGYPAYNETFTPIVNEKEYLNDQEEILENQLQQVKKRLNALKEESE